MDTNEMTPRPLDQAPRRGGLYYTADGTAHDANGNILKDAPERPKDTQPHEQPYARMLAQSSIGATPGNAGGFDAEAMGKAIARGIMEAGASRQANSEATRTATSEQAELTKGAKDAKVDDGAGQVGDASRGATGTTAEAGAGTGTSATGTGAAGAPATGTGKPNK